MHILFELLPSTWAKIPCRYIFNFLRHSCLCENRKKFCAVSLASSFPQRDSKFKVLVIISCGVLIVAIHECCLSIHLQTIHRSFCQLLEISSEMFGCHCYFITVDWRRYWIYVFVFPHFVMAAIHYPIVTWPSGRKNSNWPNKIKMPETCRKSFIVIENKTVEKLRFTKSAQTSLATSVWHEFK